MKYAPLVFVFLLQLKHVEGQKFQPFYPTALKSCQSIVFTHGVWMGGRADRQAAGKSLSGQYLKMHKLWEVDTW